MGTVATEIARQLGGRALFMMGAKNLVAGARELQFHVGRNAKGVHVVRIHLAGNDTYTVSFYRIGRGRRVKTLGEFEGIYVDQLHGLIERETGLALSLTHRYAV